MVARGDEQQGGRVGADAVEAERARRASVDERHDQVIQTLDLRVEELDSAAELT
jgi:hypothetical protein